MCDERRVLVVEDAAPIRDLLHDVLTYSGYQVTLARHGAHGLQLINTAPPCVILLDLKMPVMDGQEFVRAYRQTPPPHAFIILMTTLRDGAHHAAALQVTAHLRKPFELDHLLDLVDHHIGAHPSTRSSDRR